MFSVPTFLNLRLVPNRMDLVLSSPKWILSLLSRNHSHRSLKSLFKCVSIWVTCLCWETMQESSAYSKRSDDTACFISLTYIRKSKGPRIDPWSTPHKIFKMFEYLFSMLTKNARSVKYEWNQLTVSSQKPIAFNFSNSIIIVDSMKRLLKIYQCHTSKETIIKAFQNLVIQVWKTQISRMF